MSPAQGNAVACKRCAGKGALEVEDTGGGVFMANCPGCKGVGWVDAPAKPSVDARCAFDFKRACALDGYCDQCPHRIT